MHTKGRLFLCATPIGNLEDITLRVLHTLKNVDLIACEDTRQTLKLLNHFSIQKPITSYYEHNKTYKGEKIINEILAGKTIALVSDAGMPGISDPGYDLVVECIKKGIEITALPGAVAAITGLVVSGLKTDRFCFEGFVPREKKAKKELLEKIQKEERTIIFYESPHRVLDTLKTMSSILGNRDIVVCRELTKKFEEIIRGTSEEAWKYFKEKTIKGEFTIIVAGAVSTKEEKGMEWAKNKASQLVDEGFALKEAIKVAAKEADITKRELYDELMVKKEN